MTHLPELGDRLHRIANHGQRIKYRHDEIGCNSRLDTLQAAILDVKLKYLDAYNAARQQAAARYDAALSSLSDCIKIPVKRPDSTHVYHQYTLQVLGGVAVRDALKAYLQEQGIPTMIYYPLPLHRQPAFENRCRCVGDLPEATRLAESVLSLPMHPALTEAQQTYIAEKVVAFFNKKR